MKLKIIVSIFAVYALGWAFPALAEQEVAVKNGSPGYSDQNNLGSAERRSSNQVKANNTAFNIRDRDQNTMTPLDQGTSQADIDSTAAIRKEIMAREGMSIDAQNVKIVTLNGKVTLRGPVKTAEEKNFISETARGQVGSENVDDQLEVVGVSQRI